MDYKIKLTDFEGPLDLLLHLIKESSIEISNISVEQITKQYLDYINNMEKMNLNVASEYLVMAAELIEMKARMLLPNNSLDDADEYEEDPRESLINRLLEYKRYKDVTSEFRELEEKRKEYFDKEESPLNDYGITCEIEKDVDVGKLLEVFKKFLIDKSKDQQLNTTVTKKEYSVGDRSDQIRKILKDKKKIEFTELFDVFSKEYIVVTFLSILDLARKNELEINQDENFQKIFLLSKEVNYEE